jgi:hypothetical protein
VLEEDTMNLHKSDGDSGATTGNDDHAAHGAHAGASDPHAADLTAPRAHRGHQEARDRFGGTNWGAAFFGWLVAVGITILLTSIVGAVVAAVGSNAGITQSEAERQAGTIGIAAAVVLLSVLAIAYFTGGYVAGRMSRFDGGRQGMGVWLIGLLLTVLAIAVGAVFGNEYNIFDRVDLPRLPVSTDQLSGAGVLTALAVVLLTLLAAMTGGKLGHRYHDKVDRVAHR